MAANRRVTIKQVALEAGVSTQTVSRVLNNRPDVSPSTRRQVQQVIDRLDYRPSHAARSLSRGQSYSIGVVAYGIEYFGPSRAVSGIEKQASELGYTPLLYLLRELESTHVDQILADILSRHVDGIIWAVPEIGDNRYWLQEQIHNLPVPFVFHSMAPLTGLSTISVNNRHGGYMATRHLLDQGYQNIGLIAGPLEWWETRERVQGWRDSLKEARKEPDDGSIVEGDWTAASGERCLEQLLDQQPEMDAIFACNDQMALGALQCARRRGLGIPDDLAIVGFDDVPEAAFFWPPLTTVSQPLYDMGCASVLELQRLIDENQQENPDIQSKSIMLQPELIIRKSSVLLKEKQWPA